MIFDGRPTLSVCIVNSGDNYPCALEESLLRGMLKLGRKGVPAGCVNGGCGVCKVRIVEGTVRPLGPVSRAHVSVDEERCGITLACRVAPLTAVRLEAIGKFERPICQRPASPAGHSTTLPARRHEGDM
ncbi:MAG: 2Fe-2S iron-sulfur cluster-binding protein [Burkholderiales bacterium]